MNAEQTRRMWRGCSCACVRVRRLSVGIWSVCARGADVRDAAGDSPLVRLLLSMYIAQQNTNPVIKENVGAGRERLSRSTAAEETGSEPHTRTRTHALTQRRPPDRLGPTDTPTDRRSGPSADLQAPASGWISRLDPLGLIQGAARCVSGGRRQRARGGGGGSERELEIRRGGLSVHHFGFHDNKLRRSRVMRGGRVAVCVNTSG